MALKAGARTWLGAASGGAIDAIKAEIAGLADQMGSLALAGQQAQEANRLQTEILNEQIDALRRDLDASRGDAEALRPELETARREAAELREELRQVSQRMEDLATQITARDDELGSIHERLESGSAQTEQMRVKLRGLAEQIRWEGEDLRKALAAIVQRVERDRAES